MCLYSHSTQYSSRYSSNVKNSFNSEAHALNTISQQLHHMGGACCLHDRGVQKLTLNMLCPFLTSPGEGRPQHYITILRRNKQFQFLLISFVSEKFFSITHRHQSTVLHYSHVVSLKKYQPVSRIRSRQKQTVSACLKSLTGVES